MALTKVTEKRCNSLRVACWVFNLECKGRTVVYFSRKQRSEKKKKEAEKVLIFTPARRSF